LAPGQSPTVKWPVLRIEATPHIGTDEWQLTLDGVVENP